MKTFLKTGVYIYIYIYIYIYTAREVPLRGMRSMLNLDNLSWQESPCKLYIYIYIYNFMKTSTVYAAILCLCGKFI